VLTVYISVSLNFFEEIWLSFGEIVGIVSKNSADISKTQVFTEIWLSFGEIVGIVSKNSADISKTQVFTIIYGP